MFIFLGASLNVQASELEAKGRWLYYNNSPIWLVGYDLQQLFTDATYTEAQVKSKIDDLANYGTTCFRIWINNWFMEVDKNHWPYTYSNGKFNLDSFNEAYWNRVKNLTAYAKSKGIMVEVVVFSEYPKMRRENDYWIRFKNYWRKTENVNGVFSDVGGDFFPEFFKLNYTESGKNLTTYQERLAAKAIDELKPIGNVFFHTHNEHPAVFDANGAAIDHVYRWQQYMADYFHNTKKAISSVHAHEGGGMQTIGLKYWQDRPSVDILNFHPYSSKDDNANINAIGTTFGTLAAHGKVLMFDESHHFMEDNLVDAVTREMWASFTNGIYYLAYIDQPLVDIGSSAWKSKAQRILTLKKISEMGNWWNAVRNPSLVTAGHGQHWQGIANSGNFYVYYFTGTKSATAVSITLPNGNYSYKWFDTRSWNQDGITGGTIFITSDKATISAPNVNSWNSSSGVVLVINKKDTALPGDFNGDNKVNTLDYEIMKREFLKTGTNLKSDMNKDGKVNDLDYELFRKEFGNKK